MAVLVYIGADGQRSAFPLRPGVNRIGRVEGNDILLPDDSIAENHCEVTVDAGLVSVRDLGTTVGTAVNGAAIQEGLLLPGETLKIGNFEFVLEEDAPRPAQATEAAAAAPPIPGEACRNHPETSARWRCSKCGERFCDACISEGRQYGVPGVKFCPSCKSQAHKIGATPAGGRKTAEAMTFGGEMLAAWKYPFRGNGAIIMIAGTIFFSIVSVAQRFAFTLSLFIFIMSTGYWMAYAQKVVLASAQGEEEPPTWPDFSDMYHDIIVPFIQAVGLFVIYLLPFFLAQAFLAEGQPGTILIAGALLLIGLFMMPMAWLAISMHDSIAGLSPHFVIPSILRIPGHYFAVFLELVALVALNVGLQMALDKARLPIIGGLLNSFLGIYFGLVICRLLGSLYYLNRNRLRWF